MKSIPVAFIIFAIAGCLHSNLIADRALPSINGSDQSKDWLYESEVTFVSHHDEGRVVIDENLSLYVDMDAYYCSSGPNKADNLITYDLVQNWSPGRILKICYSTETGVVLFDPASNSHVRITSGLEEHPLDLLLEQKIEANGSTMGMIVAAEEVTAIWLKEIDSSYAKLKAAHPKKRDLIEQAQSAWENYYKLQCALILLMIDQSGTISGINNAMSRLGLVENHARRIAM